jgi:membrane fusion protein (multidrug efflux system)
VYVQEGQAVRAGQLLAMLDQTDYRLTVTQATANAVRAADEHERMKALYERGSLAPNDYAKYATNAQVTGAQAQLALEQFKDTRLVAPISGIVSRRNVDAGETVGPGAPVFSIVAIDPVEIRIGVPEAQIGMIRRGASATIAVPALAGQPFPAHVSTIGVAADAASRTYQVKLDVPNPGRQLLPGMIAEASVSGSVTMRALTVPGEAVVRDAEGATLVFVYFPNEGRVYSRRVEIGGAVDREIEITKGLTPGELVVVAGQTRVRDGSRVSATSEGAASSTSTTAGASR